MNYKTKIFFFVLSVTLFLPCFYLYNKITKDEEYIYFSILAYLCIVMFTLSWPDWKLLIFIRNILAIPASIIVFIGPLIKAFYNIFFSLTLIFGVLTLVLHILTEKIFTITIAGKVYLILTFGSIISVCYGERTTSWLIRFMNRSKTEAIVSTQIEISLGILNQKKTKYIIYVGYFIILVTASLSSLNGNIILESTNLGAAVLQSFASYIAFDRLHSNKGLFTINLKNYIKSHIKLLDLTLYKNKEEQSKNH